MRREHAAGPPMRVLLVEDQAVIRKMYVEALRDAGFSVDVAEDGLQAWEMLRTGEVEPDLVLLDLVIPGLTGFDVLERIRQDGRFDDLSVWMLTNLDGEADKRRALELGADQFLRKYDVTPRELTDLVSSALRLPVKSEDVTTPVS